MTNVKPKEHKPKSIRDPIHGFVEITADEQKIVDSPQFQRLRDISQLSFTHLVYPGATHKRFEHSLGVMHVASEIFDAVVNVDNLKDDIKKKFRKQLKQKDYWRQVLRLAALCHDIGHLPFSHTLEDLLKEETEAKTPGGISHEDLSKRIIEEDLGAIIGDMDIIPQEVAYIATGIKDDAISHTAEELEWLDVLAKIITSDLFGADRIDYIIRDAYHSGVPYGNIDIHQLLRAMKSVKKLLIESGHDNTPALSDIKEGDRAMLASFLMSRQLMYSLVYQHPVCKVYDMHLEDFVSEYVIPKKILGIESLEDLVKYTDSDLLHILHNLDRGSDSKNKHHAERLLQRKHFKWLNKLNFEDVYKLNSKLISRKIKGNNFPDIREIQKNIGSNSIDYFCEQVNEKFGRKVIGNKNRMNKSKEQSREEFTGYAEILQVLQGGSFGYCYIYVDRDMEKQVTKFLEKI